MVKESMKGEGAEKKSDDAGPTHFWRPRSPSREQEDKISAMRAVELGRRKRVELLTKEGK
jgi:hypothetical protein